MKKHMVFALLLINFLLIGCLGCGEVESGAETETSETTQPAETGQTESTAQTEPEEQADAYPFGNVEDLEYLSYDEYFGEIRKYQMGVNMIPMLSWKWGDSDGYSLVEKGDFLSVEDPSFKCVHQIIVSPQCEDCEWAFADGYWIYGIRNEEELFRFDYFGEHYQTLFYDGIHTIPVMQRDHPGPQIWVLDYCVAFFTIYTDDSATICRLYLPTMTLDTIYTSDFPDLLLGGLLSNEEIIWSEPNPELVEMITRERNDPDSEYYGLSVGELKYMLSHANHIPSGYSHYFNAATGEHYMVGEDENGWPYYGRTPENIEKNGGQWWKDFQ